LKLVRFMHEEQVDYGFVVGGSTAPHSEVDAGLPSTLDELVKSGMLNSPEKLTELHPKVKASQANLLIKKVKLLHPLEKQGKIICLGSNYPEPGIEDGYRPPQGIPFILKPQTSLAGPYEPILMPNFVRKLDYEGELAVVVGRRAKWITPQEVPNVLLGYMIANDVSARDVQIDDRQWTRGKGFDTFAPMGPWITTKEEVPLPLSLYIKTWVNEELRQDGNTSFMMRKTEELFSELSRGMTLEAGDVVLTGTPSGVGFYTRPEPKMLSPGDKVRVEIERLGYIENMVRKVP
jgi:2-keto-4-pentenoate hydratase/2-oxohepta-3-ene-1,7-dioic acid hydratase in catechol pathway